MEDSIARLSADSQPRHRNDSTLPGHLGLIFHARRTEDLVGRGQGDAPRLPVRGPDALNPWEKLEDLLLQKPLLSLSGHRDFRRFYRPGRQSGPPKSLRKFGLRETPVHVSIYLSPLLSITYTSRLPNND